MRGRWWGRGSRRLLGLVAAPILIGSCGPTQCTPAPPAPPPTTTTTAPPVTPEWAFLVDNLPEGGYSRWDPCDGPITYQLDGASPPEQAAIREAVATAAAATGFTFEEVTSDGEAVVGVKDFTAPEYPPGTLGEGGGDVDLRTGEMSSGVAYASRGLDAATLRYALLHEIGHMLGLGHVDSPAEVMYEWALEPPKQQYAPGDLEGLQLVGTMMPCFNKQALRVWSPEQTVIVH